MVDPASLAAASVAALSPYLIEGGKEAAKTVGKEAASGAVRVLGWLRGKLTGAGAEALEEVEKSPQNGDAQAALRLQVRKLVEREPALAGELRALLAEVPEPAVQQIINQAGDHNRAANVQGTGNTVNMG